MRFMRFFSAATVLMGLSALPASATTFTFYETGCASGGLLNGTCFSQPAEPLAIAEMTISQETGTAVWQAFGWGGPALPVVSDPLFSFTNYDRWGGVVIQPPDFTGARSYDISWTASGDELLAVSIFSAGWNTITNLGLTSGVIGSDASLGTCMAGSCSVTGFWLDPVAVPEPVSWLLFLSVVAVCSVWRLSKVVRIGIADIGVG